MDEDKQRRWILYVLLLFIIVGMSAAGLLLWRVPDIEQQFPPHQTPIMVFLTHPADNGIIVQSTEIQVEAVSEAQLDHFELWADGLLIESVIPTQQGQTYSASTTWMPAAEGQHTLIMRAVDTVGRAGQSNVVHVRARSTTEGIVLDKHRVAADDTLESIAAAADVTPEDILSYNSQLSDDGSLPVGETINIPRPLPAPEPLAPSSSPQTSAPPQTPPDRGEPSPPSRIAVWLRGSVLPNPSTPPLPPALSASVTDCSAELVIDDSASSESGFFVYRADQASAAFERIAVLGSNRGTASFSYNDPELTGTYLYYVTAFNPAGEASSGLVEVNINEPDCKQDDWSGIALEDGVLTVPQSVERVYFYLSISGKTAVRIPSDRQQFIIPVDGKANARPFLDEADLSLPTRGGPLEIEAWGWQDGTLVNLGGGGTVSPSTAVSIGTWMWDWTSLDLLIGASNDPSLQRHVTEFNFSQPESLDFVWRTGHSAVTHAIWQVSTVPFSSEPSLEPSGLVAQGRADRAGEQNWFEVDFAPVVGPLEWPEPGREPTRPPQWPEPAHPGTAQASPLNLQNGEQVTLTTANPSLDVPIPREYYVRVLPMNGNQLAGAPSNHVLIRFSPPSDPDIVIETPEGYEYQQLYVARMLSFTPAVFPDPDLAGCVQVVEILGETLIPFEISEIICPKSYKGAGGYSVGEALSDLVGAFNFVVNLYNSIKETVVGFIADLISPLCDFTGMDQSNCEAVAAYAVDAALASMGLPPELPDFEQLIEEGQAYVTSYATEFISDSTGVPCIEICEDAVADLIDRVAEDLKHMAVNPSCLGEEEAHKLGIEPLCLPPNVIVKPAPGSIYEPPVIRIELTRNPSVPDPPAPEDWPRCGLQATFEVQNYWPGGYLDNETLPAGYQNEVPAQEIQGEPYAPIGVILPKLEQGESTILTLAFGSRQPYFIPGNEPDPRSQIVDDTLGDWFWLYNGGEAAITVDASFSSNISGYNRLPCFAERIVHQQSLPRR